MIRADDASRAADRRALLLCAGWALLTFAIYIVWNRFMAERSVDEAYFENILWNASHGHGLRTSVEGAGDRGLGHLALHFSPAIWLVVPLYALFPSMHLVHLIVSIGAAAAGVLLYRWARETLDPGISTALMAAFLLNPTIMLQTFMETHDQALAIYPLMALLRAYHRSALVTALVAGLAFVAIREENALLVLGLGALALLVKRDVRLAAALLALGAGWIALWQWYGVGQLAGGRISHLWAGTYGIWGDTPGAFVRAILAQPGRVLRHVFSPIPIAYLIQLLAPFLLVLGFGSPLVLVMVPQLLLILLANHETRMFTLRMHYSIVPVVLLFVGSIGTLTWIARHNVAIGRGARRRAAAPVLAGTMLAVALAVTPVWGVRAFTRLNPHATVIRRAMAVVPDTSSLTAPDYILNHMAQRPQIHKTWMGPITLTDYTILEEPGTLGYVGPRLDTPYSDSSVTVLEGAGYTEVYARDGLHVWRRAATGSAPGSAP